MSSVLWLRMLACSAGFPSFTCVETLVLQRASCIVTRPAVVQVQVLLILLCLGHCWVPCGLQPYRKGRSGQASDRRAEMQEALVCGGQERIPLSSRDEGVSVPCLEVEGN